MEPAEHACIELISLKLKKLFLFKYFKAPYTANPAAPPPLSTKCLIVFYLKLLM